MILFHSHKWPIYFGWFLIMLFAFSSCKKEEEKLNQAPETDIAIQEINLSGEDRLSSLVRLRWWGTDPDGVVNNYEISFDQVEWISTPLQDSTFQFVISAGSDTVDIDFWVRSVDDEGEKDESPAYLRIPLKNTPPEIEILDQLFPSDTAFLVSSISWSASDLDGSQTIDRIELKLNDGEWVGISNTRTFVAIVPNEPKATGITSADLVYIDGTRGPEINGLNLEGENTFYVRSVDIAGSESKIDTSETIIIRNQVNDILVLGVSNSSANQFYKDNLDELGLAYDFVDGRRADSKNLPKPASPTFDPTFGEWIGLYSTVVLYSSDAGIQITGGQFADYARNGIQNYLEGNGKMLFSTAFSNDIQSSNPLFGILPMDSLSSAEGLARLPIDSLAVGENGYPDLITSVFISGLDPIYQSADSKVIYRANLTKNGGWEGPNVIGVKRPTAGNTDLIFFSAELHRLNKDEAATDLLFEKIFNEEFNW